MKTIFLIAYYFRPYKGVGAFRLSYWYDRLKESGYCVKVITATKDSDNELNSESSDIIRIMPQQDKGIFHRFIKDESYFWGKQCRELLKKFLEEDPASIILITGGPFLHFASLMSIKKYFPQSKWILDYRDPLTYNPRTYNPHILGKIRRIIKKCYEAYVNSRANVILTVNSVCRDLIVSGRDVRVIDNGYDERFFENIQRETSEAEKLVYAGKLYGPRNIENLLISMQHLPDRYSLNYIGKDFPTVKLDRIMNFGIKDYEATVKIMQNSTIGVVLASGMAFESTTKIFDYFAAKLKILIITNGEIKTGMLHEITKENPNVEWTQNNVTEIIKAIKRLDRAYINWDYQRFSRDFGFIELVNIIERI